MPRGPRGEVNVERRLLSVLGQNDCLTDREPWADWKVGGIYVLCSWKFLPLPLFFYMRTLRLLVFSRSYRTDSCRLLRSAEDMSTHSAWGEAGNASAREPSALPFFRMAFWAGDLPERFLLPLLTRFRPFPDPGTAPQPQPGGNLDSITRPRSETNTD